MLSTDSLALPGESESDASGESATGDQRRLRSRKPFGAAVAKALATLESIASTLHRNELAGVKLEGLSSVGVLSEISALQQFIHADGEDEPLDVYYRLAEYQAALDQHEEAIAVLQALLERQQKRLGERHLEIAKLLRQLANSYEKLQRTTECVAARREALEIAAELLGKPEVVDVLSSIVADQAQGTSGGAVKQEAWTPAAVPAGTGKAPQVAPRRGEIWWVEFPQYPNDPHQPRPAVVVSVDHRNARADKVQVVPLSSKDNGHRMNFAISRKDSGLQYDSCAKCGDLTAVSKTMLRGQGPLGAVPQPLVDGIVDLAQQALKQ